MKDNNLEEGWVEAQVIRNVFQHSLRKLDEMLPTSERFPIKDLVTELFEKAKFEILKHRKDGYELLKRHPELKTDTPNQKEAHDRRIQAMKTRQV